MRQRVLPALIRRAILIAALVFVQAGAATHIDLDDTHPAGEACVFCVGLATLGAANVGSTTNLNAVVLSQQVVATPAVVAVSRRVDPFSIRGPPKTS